MEINGTRTLPASRAKVWKALHDADLLADSITGCEALEWVSDNELKGRLNMKIGPVKAKFNIFLTISDSEEECGYTLEGSAKAGALGFAGGEAKISLSDAEEGCELSYEAQLKTGGKIAQIGSRLMSSLSKKLVDDFFDAFVTGMES